MFIEYVAYDGARFANKDDCKCYELENNVIFCKTIEKDDKVDLQKITIKELTNDNELVEDVDLIFKTEDGDWVSLFGEYEYIIKIITEVLKFDGIKEKKGW